MLREKNDHFFFQILASNTQHVATRRNMVAKRVQHVAPRMLRYVALKCCHRLAEKKKKKGLHGKYFWYEYIRKF